MADPHLSNQNSHPNMNPAGGYPTQPQGFPPRASQPGPRGQGQFPGGPPPPNMMRPGFPPQPQGQYNPNQPRSFPPNNQPGQFPPNNQPGQFPPNNQPAGQFPPTSQPGQFPPSSQSYQFPPSSQSNQFPPTSQPYQFPSNQLPPHSQPGQFPPTNPGQFPPTSMNQSMPPRPLMGPPPPQRPGMGGPPPPRPGMFGGQGPSATPPPRQNMMFGTQGPSATPPPSWQPSPPPPPTSIRPPTSSYQQQPPQPSGLAPPAQGLNRSSSVPQMPQPPRPLVNGTHSAAPTPPPMFNQGASFPPPPPSIASQQEPASQRSSRAPSPLSEQQFDALEGQFSSNPVTPQTGSTANTAPLFPGQQQTLSPQGQGQGAKGFSPGGQQPPQGFSPGGQQPPGGFSPQQPPPPPSNLPPTSQSITGRRVYPQMPQTSQASSQQPPPPPTVGQPYQPNNYQGAGNNMGGQQPNYPQPPGPQGPPAYNNQPQPHQNNNMAQMNAAYGNMKIQPDYLRPINLLQERSIIPPKGVEIAKPELGHDYKKVNSNPEIFQCTLNAIPNTQSLLSKARLPLGLLIHPFKDLAQLPVIQSSVIVRCRSCRTYINPYVSFVDMRRWKCNLCYRVNELPEEFNYDPVSKSYGEPQRRPEIKSSTIEFIAPSEYMLRPPQPAAYLFVLDVSFNAVETGYLQVFCQTLLDEIERLPGDSRTQIGFITYDSSLHFYNLSEELSRPQMMVVSDVDEVFLPSPDGLLANLQESKELITDLIGQLPDHFRKNMDTGSALGAALQAAYKLMSPTGGRITVMQTQLPTVGPGALKNREDPNERAGKKISNLGPATDFYKKLALDCSAQQIAVDLFLLNSQYADVSTIACASKYSGGSLHSFPGLHSVSNASEMDRFEGALRRYLTRKIGFEAVMRIRCTRGLSIHTFHGNFFVRSTDLLSLPNINPDAGFGMQMSIEDTLEGNFACAQAALLYTSSKGERRIRVHTLCLPVTNTISEVYQNADQRAIIGLLSKMAVDKSLSQSMGDARDALVNAAIDMLTAYGRSLTNAQRLGQLPAPHTLRLMPLYVLALLKSYAFRVGASTKLDDRVVSLESLKTLPIGALIQSVYPNLYPVHMLNDENGLSRGDQVIPQPPIMQLSMANTDRHGAYLMDTGFSMYLWLGAAVTDTFCQELFDVPNFHAVTDAATDLPEIDTPTSERLRLFIGHLNESRPFPASLTVIKEDSRNKNLFLQHMVEDRTESTFSYYEFLQHLQKEVGH